jgi:plastocyanin
MRSVRYLALLAVVGVGLVVAGCGGGGGGGGGGSSSGPTMPIMQPPGQVENGRVVVDIKNAEYNPKKLSIPAETQVVWTNSDNTEHSVAKSSGPGPAFNSGPLQPGSTFSQVLKDTGTYSIKDESTKSGAAPTMTIIVKSKSSSQPAPGGAPGSKAQPSG